MTALFPWTCARGHLIESEEDIYPHTTGRGRCRKCACLRQREYDAVRLGKKDEPYADEWTGHDPSRLSVIMPKNKVFAEAIKLWSAEKGITLEQRAPTGLRMDPELRCRPKMDLEDPYICRKGHVCHWVYLKTRKERPRPMKLCPICADACEARRNEVRRVRT